MADFSEKLTRKQEQAIFALLSNRSVEDAARACHTPVRTLFRWLKEPDFNAAYRDLGKVMLDAGTPPATKVRAADSILNHTIKAIETEDIEARLAALEQSAAEGNQRR